MDIKVEKDKTPAQIRKESKAIATQFVDLTVNGGMSSSRAIATLADENVGIDLQNETIQREITRLLRKQNLSNEQMNALLTAKLTETMLTADRVSDQLKAADVLAKKKDIGWAPSEKISINIGFRSDQEELLEEILKSTDKYYPQGDIIDVTPEEPDNG